MAIATWWREDLLPFLAPIADFRVELSSDMSALAELNRLSIDELEARYAAGNRAYIAFFQDQPVAYGWVATAQILIGELALDRRLSARDRYLWDFATLPAWQGRGFYPRLLQAILRHEQRNAERFWIIYAPENLPSSAGMRKAGFTTVADLSYDRQQRVQLAPMGERERPQSAAELFGLPLAEQELAPCWSCQSQEASSCWPEDPALAKLVCSCSIQPQSSGTIVVV
jgi:GNAT superfamily N-acetyltransferase